MLTRRRLLTSIFAGGPTPRARKVLVVVFLRGGADGLALVPPHADPALARLRPSLASRRPGDGDPGAVLDLDGTFGLHPALAPLLPRWRDGTLAIVHAVGSDDATRSHFEAQDLMEHGASSSAPVAGGWLGRLLRAEGAGGLSAVAVGRTVPEALRGAPMAAAFESLADLEARSVTDARALAALEALYAREPGVLGQGGRDTLDLLRKVGAMARRPAAERPTYPAGPFGAGLRDLADLVRADLGLRAATIDLPGWDTHVVQETLLPARARELAGGLAALWDDLGPRAGDVDVVVMTEFGRRAHENVSLGTDHGRGSVMFVLGQGIAGGRVHGRWPGLGDDALEGPGDLAVTTDYRDVLGEVVLHAGGPAPDVVFPGHRSRPVGLLG